MSKMDTKGMKKSAHFRKITVTQDDWYRPSQEQKIVQRTPVNSSLEVINTVKGGDMLGDIQINNFLNVLQTKASALKISSYFFTSFFFASTKKKFKVEMKANIWFIPINHADELHWSLVVLEFGLRNTLISFR